ncbi:MAG: ABC transporter ATP-binding protein/permease [Candidatus Eisenbacteria bacterium]|uniref:ABC transporter ATP-binding protein/permease n=1 Tax=Eiseniibacteriota bacterium TaxID=2212470 RepID=A0A948WB06_UNCEI|nr:ABC transporter ATP-binding protein/permease [Candidatus Eisenbacteria bacterium]MBU1948509.1 ABC transporter ATP-binding protein/permease [Candidatus Eisenbacteria bacterium]MBU2689528.1 ABC transporter ATP-binding protein/permease [Candidatus Eisenbacteria bacterium]
MSTEQSDKQAETPTDSNTREDGMTSRNVMGSGTLKGVKAHLRWLWGYWRPHTPILISLTLFTLVSTAVAVAYPLVFRWVIDRLTEIVGQSSEGAKIVSVMTALGFIALGRIVAGLYPATRALMNLRLDKDIREDVFGHLMQKDYCFNNAFRTGDVVTRLTDDIYEFPKISWFGCSGIFRAIESASKMLFCLGVMMTLNWKLTLVSVIPLPIMMWLFYNLRHKIRLYVQASQESISKTSDLLEAAFSGIRIVKAFRAEEGQSNRLSELMKERRGIFLGLMKIQTVLWSLDTLASRVGQMIVIAVGGYMVIRGEMTIGTLFAFYVFLDMLAHPMMDLPHLFMTGQQAFVSIDRVEEIKQYPVKITREKGDELDEIQKIAFDNVSFAYDDGRMTVSEATFQISAGSRVAIVGPVASGKSTLLKLLAGILIPQKGEVRVNGRLFSEWDWDSYRRHLGYVPQEGVLFSKSVAENVLFGRSVPDAENMALTNEGAAGDTAEDMAVDTIAETAQDEEWTRRCLSIAQMNQDLKVLPEGMQTMVGQKGSLVSGGQKQRIAIARALAGRPRVLLLDDCTAALDAHNEDRFWERLDNEFGNCTCFIVSHRLATIRRADRILVLNGGRLVDQGTHDELAVRCDTYRKFLITEHRKAHLKASAGGVTSAKAQV